MVISAPLYSWLISWFWQNTHFKLQCEKNTVPEPFSQDIGGSSQRCNSALATIRLSLAVHIPS